MSTYIKKFDTLAELNAAKSSMPRPCVAFSVEGSQLYYKPIVLGAIEFEDSAVKAILVNSTNPKIDTNEDGEITTQEAAAVTSIGYNTSSLFYEKASIVNFPELSYFTHLSTLEGVFDHCTNLEKIHIGISTGNAVSLANTFETCSKLTEVQFENSFNAKISSLERTFYGCSALKTLDLHKLDVSDCVNYTRTFNNCTSLVTLNISGWDINQNATFTDTFTRASKIKTIIMDGCSDYSIGKIKENWEPVLKNYSITNAKIIDNTGTLSQNGAGTYSFNPSTEIWTFTPTNN